VFQDRLTVTELEKPNIENVGTSARKLAAIDPQDFEVEEGFGYRILNFLAIFLLYRKLLCVRNASLM